MPRLLLGLICGLVLGALVVAMDRSRIVSITDTLLTPSGKYTGVLLSEETTQIEPGKEYKRYAPGIGLVQDGDLKLVSRVDPR